MFPNEIYLTRKQAIKLSNTFKTHKKITLNISVYPDLILSIVSIQSLAKRKMSPPDLINLLSNHPCVALALTETVIYLIRNLGIYFDAS